MIPRIHAAAGVIGFLTILTFWSSTVASELFGSHETVAAVKQAILWGMLLLVPAMAAAGGTGFKLLRSRTGSLALAKRRRMMVIGPNGVLVLMPCAFFLESLATKGQFTATFYAVQAVELAADAAVMQRQPGYISTQLHRGIGGSCVFLNYAVWESTRHFKQAFNNPEFQSHLAHYPSSAVASPHLFRKVAVPGVCVD